MVPIGIKKPKDVLKIYGQIPQIEKYKNTNERAELFA